jgi:2-amino-4-hydroxy-6-hydroxymethyldihydropteridine diphosphokinase
MGCAEGTPSFLNAVCEISISVPPILFLRGMRALEQAMGRPISYARNSPRVMDLDMLYAGDEIVHTEELILPHPRMFERLFVLKPLAEIRPELVLPGQTQSIESLLNACMENQSIKTFSEELV